MPSQPTRWTVRPDHLDVWDIRTSKASVEQEQENNLSKPSSGIALQSLRICCRQTDHTNGHASSTEQHQLSSSKLLDCEDRNPRCQKVFGAVASCNQLGQKGRQANFVLNHIGYVLRICQLLFNVFHGNDSSLTYVMRLIPDICWKTFVD